MLSNIEAFLIKTIIIVETKKTIKANQGFKEYVNTTAPRRHGIIEMKTHEIGIWAFDFNKKAKVIILTTKVKTVAQAQPFIPYWGINKKFARIFVNAPITAEIVAMYVKPVE